MSRDNSSVRSNSRTNPISYQSEANENDSDNLRNQIPYPPPSRTPLHSIPDPSQLHNCKESSSVKSSEVVFDNNQCLQHLILTKGNGTGTHRVLNRAGKSHSEPNSAQSTPAKGIPRVSNVGGKGGSFSRASRGISSSNYESVVEVPHFELAENPSFWKDHNVQVLIRIRPLNSIEKVSQEYCRCLKQESAQTLVWLGHPETRFTFDHVACETISQENLFKVAGLPIVENCMSGYNSCIFAYGQTGSGKTYTMMGEIGQIDGKLNEDCGITPRIFEHLFKRIREEEDNIRNERLKYSCKCSFLEIYNEQITDLLEPSSTNLQLREDLKKGVYVDNLTEYNVRTVDDVLRLLLQGTANRKISATHMNSESSRSHSVFTCIIESHWEKDAMTHLRFGRLNLVDLAGSERQKSSGAEGDRLKEAANINKSLSTLGLVIMSLVDLAHGKQRHVPYRDSRLTFLLQDSLGGNSKTTIIANISPSICSANETLSTLKFAQRAKLIQNNAKVNEDASGDVTALQRQIQQLKGQLSFLLKHHNSSDYFSHGSNFEEYGLGSFSERFDSSEEMIMDDNHRTPKSRKIKRLKDSLLGAMRREKLAELEVNRLKAEIEQMKHLVHYQEEDAQRAKMVLRFRDDKIKLLELLSDGLVSIDSYLMDENNALREPMELLEARFERNPKLIQFALENSRLLEQLREFQDFYEQGERDQLLPEISEQRDQFLKLLEVEEGSGHPYASLSEESQESSIAKELKEQRDMNAKLVSEVEVFQEELRRQMNLNQPAPCSVKVMLDRSDSVDEMTSSSLPEDGVLRGEDDKNMNNELVLQFNNIQKELMDSRSLLEAMESEQIRLIEELELVRNENCNLKELLQNQTKVRCKHWPDTGSYEDSSKMVLQAKLDKVSKDLNEAQIYNCHYLENPAWELSRDEQIELVQQEVEMETAKTILHLQEEITIMQSELQGRLHSVAEENARLRNCVADKENEIRALSADWERATLELTTFLTDGSKSITDAFSQIESITCLFPRVNLWIGEHIERAVKMCIEKEETILILKMSLEEAQKTVLELDQKLTSLKGAAIALTEVQQLEDDARSMKEMQSANLQNDKINKLGCSGNKIMYKEEQKAKSENFTKSTSLRLTRSYQQVGVLTDDERNVQLTSANAPLLDDMKIGLELAHFELLEVEDAINASCSDAESHFSAIQSDIHKAFSLYKELFRGLMNDIHNIRRNFSDLKVNCQNVQSGTARSPSIYSHKPIKHESRQQIVHEIRDELVRISDKLNSMCSCFYRVVNTCASLARAEIFSETEGWTSDSSTSKSSAESITSRNKSNQKFPIGYHHPLKKRIGQTSDQELEGTSSDSRNSEEPQSVVNSLSRDEANLFCLQKDLRAACDAFDKIYTLLTVDVCSKDAWDVSATGPMKELHLIKQGQEQALTPQMGEMVQNDEEMMLEAEATLALEKFNAVDNMAQAESFFTRFKEAHATVNEADYMLNALLKANENAKLLTSTWKKSGEELMGEKANLVEEIKQLKSTINLKDGEFELLREQIHSDLMEIVNSMFSLEGPFLQDTEDLCKRVCSDAILMVKDTLDCICSFRSLLEDIFSKMTENSILSFVLHHCHLGEFAHELESLNIHSGLNVSTLEEAFRVVNNLGKSYKNVERENMLDLAITKREEHQNEMLQKLESDECGLAHHDLINENVELKRELQRKEVLLKGLLFDFTLLQESASSRKDAKDETERLITALNQVPQGLTMKKNQFDNLLIQHRTLEGRLTETENALFLSNSELEQARCTLDVLSEQNAELRVLLKDLYLKKSETEQRLDEQSETVKDLENEILRMASLAEKSLATSLQEINDDLQRVTTERDDLLDQLHSLEEKVDFAYALADEKEAIALEVRQESEASKVYAEQKEEEVKILEHSVEELESTINVLEKKVYEMEEKVERHRAIRDSFEVEMQELRERLMMVESITDNLDHKHSSRELSESQFSRTLHGGSKELHEAHNQIRVLEEGKAKLAKETRKYKEYVSELVLHAEAQASQYQQKYKNLEVMVQEVRTDTFSLICGAPILDKTEKSSARPRGSSSPFRCISSLVQQMNLEKDQELSIAKLRIEELEAMVASRQKEVCLLNTRLAAVESMTHDVIRDLLGVKLDMTNYADLISQNRLQKLVEEAQQQTNQYIAMEKEVSSLRGQINDLIQERERCIFEVKRKGADVLTAQMRLEQLRERDQLLTAQNEMLKADKTSLQRRLAELDDMVKKLIGTQNIKPRQRQLANSLSRPKDQSHGMRLNHSEKPLLLLNNELAHFRKTDGFA